MRNLTNFRVIQTQADLLTIKARLGRWQAEEKPTPAQLKYVDKIKSKIEGAIVLLNELEVITE